MVKLEIVVWKMKCTKCGKIEYIGEQEGLVGYECTNCPRENVTMEPTGETSLAEFDEF